MRETSITRLLVSVVLILDLFDLFWVTPESYQRTWEKKKEDSRWENWMWDRVQKGGEKGGPIPTSALEFVCDLWATYLEQRRRI